MKINNGISKCLAESVVVLAMASFMVSTSAVEEIPFLDSTEVTVDSTHSGELYISKDSQYCDWNKTMGPLCIYTGTDEVVVVPERLELPFGKLELEIRGAKTVHVYPACVPWIMVKNAGLITTLPYKDSSNLDHKLCRTWLRIRDSRADTISIGVRDLSIKQTWVNTISLMQQKDFSAISSTIISIESLDWEGYPSEILNTTIQSISRMVAGGDLWIIDSHFGSIAHRGISFRASEMDITNTTISYISPQGIRILSGIATFSNVVINRLESFAIVVENPSAVLNLYNVTIISALVKCIVLPDRERLFIKNVTIQNMPLNFSSPFLKFWDDYDTPENVTKVQIRVQMEPCSFTSSSLTCDFNSVDEIIELEATNTKGYKHVEIKRAKSLQVLSMGCNQYLRLESVNGSLPHLTTKPNNPSSDNSTAGDSTSGDEPCEMTLSALNSKLGVIYAKDISQIIINNSTADRLHEGTLDVLNMKNFTVGTMDSIRLNGVGGKWMKVKVGVLLNLTIESSVTAEDFVINSKLRKGAIIIDHAKATTEISKMWVSIGQREGLVVRNGKLVLKDLRFSELLEGSIYVEEGAAIEINRIIGMPDYASISVATREQVALKGISNWYAERMIHVRNHPPPPDMGSNLTVSNVHLSPYCRKFNITYSYRECDFSHVENATVTIDLEGTEQTYQTVEIRNASLVKLYPSCIRKLYLVKVKEATTVDNEKACETWLEANGVNFNQITAGVHDVTLTNCRVKLFAPYRMLKDLDLENTHIERVAGVHWYGYMGVFNSSHFGKIEGLVASSFIFILNTTVDNILPKGISVLADGLIVNSSISSIESMGLTVEGGLRIANVTIGHLAERSIVVKDGVLVLSNVTIGSSEEQSIMATMNGAVAMQNVTVAGKKVHWRGYITDSLGPDDASLVFVNKYVSEETGTTSTEATTTSNSSSSSSSSTNEPSKTDQASSLQVPESQDDDSPTFLPPKERVSREMDLTASTWKWVGVTLSVILVILVGCCIVLAVALVKTNNGRMLPVVFWRVKDDHNGLVAEDQPSPNFVGITTRHSGYHPMSGAYENM